ncbi:MAG: hypothetical protein KatS3mg101_0052 [Patescibacteria group bacterium]|nr:MAG: hypothetical protein KatS3mg101_0052 [Patescibacteria group bacterium]
MKKIKFLFPLFFFLITLIFGSKHTYAIQCEVEKDMFDKNLAKCLLGISLTECDFRASFVTGVYGDISGYGLSEQTGCGWYVADTLGIPPEEREGTYYECTGTSREICEEMISVQGGTTGSRENWLTRYSKSRSSGTLLGFAYLAENFNRYEALPVNLAYYTDDVVSRVPFVNKVYAQEYKHPLISSILGVWKVFRDLAYALMAIILLYTGIIIILRRKINSQLVVSIQYALPRIVIAIVLITFSYPIGATLGTMAWTFFKSGWAIVASMFAGRINATAGVPLQVPETPWGLRLWFLMLPLVVLTGAGLSGLVLVLVFLVIFLIAGIIFNVKAIVIYLKIIFSILTAPIEFAIGAVPGNDSKIKDWFMRMAKYLLTLLFMGIIVPLGSIVALLITRDYASETGGVGYLIQLALPIFVVLYCFGVGIGMEKRIEDFLAIGKKR